MLQLLRRVYIQDVYPAHHIDLGFKVSNSRHTTRPVHHPNRQFTQPEGQTSDTEDYAVHIFNPTS
jgi:hypothetical protein